MEQEQIQNQDNFDDLNIIKKEHIEKQKAQFQKQSDALFENLKKTLKNYLESLQIEELDREKNYEVNFEKDLSRRALLKTSILSFQSICEQLLDLNYQIEEFKLINLENVEDLKFNKDKLQAKLDRFSLSINEHNQKLAQNRTQNQQQQQQQQQHIVHRN